MSHSSWKMTKGKRPEGNYKHLIAFDRGYILALEDVIRDVDLLRAGTSGEEQNLLLLQVQNKILTSWNSAQRTLAKLLDQEEEHET